MIRSINKGFIDGITINRINLIFVKNEYFLATTCGLLLI